MKRAGLSLRRLGLSRKRRAVLDVKKLTCFLFPCTDRFRSLGLWPVWVSSQRGGARWKTCWVRLGASWGHEGVFGPRGFYLGGLLVVHEEGGVLLRNLEGILVHARVGPSTILAGGRALVPELLERRIHLRGRPGTRMGVDPGRGDACTSGSTPGASQNVG